MAVPWLRTSRFLRALVLTAWASSFLVWLYIVLRVVVNGVDPPSAFFNSIPHVSFSMVGTFAFFVFFASMFLYLWLWGRFRSMPTFPPGPPPRQY